MSDARRPDRRDPRDRRAHRPTFAPDRAPDRAQEERPDDPAVITGNLAGVVESANEAWTRITGFPLAETLEKPITHFLDRAGIELALVDFVREHFMEGRSCTVEFPFRTFDSREIRVHLEVEPIHDPRGERVAFRAVAHDITERRELELARGEMPGSPPCESRPTRSVPSEEPRLDSPWRDGAPTEIADCRSLVSFVSLDERIIAACREGHRASEARTHFDLDLEPHLPSIETNIARFDELVRGLLERARRRVEGRWGWVTLSTGRSSSDRSHVSRVHPIVARFSRPLAGPHLYLEIHDSAPSSGLHGCDEDGRAHLAALADALSMTLHFDDTPGCGHQALLLIPITPWHRG